MANTMEYGMDITKKWSSQKPVGTAVASLIFQVVKTFD
jgi:hypothetical protein